MALCKGSWATVEISVMRFTATLDRAFSEKAGRTWLRPHVYRPDSENGVSCWRMTQEEGQRSVQEELVCLCYTLLQDAASDVMIEKLAPNLRRRTSSHMFSEGWQCATRTTPNKTRVCTWLCEPGSTAGLIRVGCSTWTKNHDSHKAKSASWYSPASSWQWYIILFIKLYTGRFKVTLNPALTGKLIERQSSQGVRGK